MKPSRGLEFVGQFLERLPKMPSHYCRKDTKKLYLETGFQSYAVICAGICRVQISEGDKWCMQAKAESCLLGERGASCHRGKLSLAIFETTP